jgi:hypothetical protein
MGTAGETITAHAAEHLGVHACRGGGEEVEALYRHTATSGKGVKTTRCSEHGTLSFHPQLREK